MQGHLKRKINIHKRKKNIAGGLKFLIGKSHDLKGSSKRNKNTDLFSDTFQTIDNPQVKEMIEKYKKFNWGNNSEGTKQNFINLFGGDGEDGPQKFQIKGDPWGNNSSGSDWSAQQKKMKKQNLQILHEQDISELTQDNIQQQQIIYIQPGVAEEKLEQLREEGKPFSDQNFPPNENSLTGVYGHDPNWDPIKWKKLSAVYKNSQIFIDKANPRDIRQGYLGDCYFLAAIAALAQRPDRIYEIFLLDEKNQLHYYSVKMIYRGKWRTVDLDQFIPFVFKNPAFSKSQKQQLWVMLLEKAWAKLYGSYKQIEAGYAEEPLHDLTGAPIKYLFPSKNPQQVWEYLLKASELQYAMVTSSNPGSDTETSSSGIVQGHAYTFLNATLLDTGDGDERVVQLRNPWGSGEFKGKWSDSDDGWNNISQAEKKRVDYDANRHDGIFFMNYDDFTKEFSSMTVAQINDNASYVYASCIDEQCEGAYFTIKIPKAGKYSFQVDKTPERTYTGEKQLNFRYPHAQFTLGKLEESHTKKFRGLVSARRTLFQQHDLEPGIYVAFVKISYDPYYEKDFEVTLAVYSQYPCSIRLSNQQQAIKFSGNEGVDWNENKKPITRQSKHLGKTSKKRNLSKNVSAQQKKASPKAKSQVQDSFKFPKKSENKKANQSQSLNETQSKIKSKTNSKLSLMSRRNESPMRSLMEKKPIKSKRIRTVEFHTSKKQVTREKKNGQAIKKTEITENEKQSILTNDDRKQTKDKNIKTQSIQNIFKGQVLKQTENYVEKLEETTGRKDGEIIRKVEVKEGQIETLEEDDDEKEFPISQNDQEDAPSENEEILLELENDSDMDEDDQKKVMNAMEKKIYGNQDKFAVHLAKDEGTVQETTN